MQGSFAAVGPCSALAWSSSPFGCVEDFVEGLPSERESAFDSWDSSFAPESVEKDVSFCGSYRWLVHHCLVHWIEMRLALIVVHHLANSHTMRSHLIMIHHPSHLVFMFIPIRHETHPIREQVKSTCCGWP